MTECCYRSTRRVRCRALAADFILPSSSSHILARAQAVSFRRHHDGPEEMVVCAAVLVLALTMCADTQDDRELTLMNASRRCADHDIPLTALINRAQLILLTQDCVHHSDFKSETCPVRDAEQNLQDLQHLQRLLSFTVEGLKWLRSHSIRVRAICFSIT